MRQQDVFSKKPFARIRARGYSAFTPTSDIESVSYPTEKKWYTPISQSDFVREFYPTGHKIYSETFYPDKIHYNTDENGVKNYYKQKVSRIAMPFQMVITTQQLIHICGNTIRFKLTDESEDEARNNLFLSAKRGWLEKNMEIAFYNIVKSCKITGDGAIIFYLYNGKMYTKNISFLTGDSLYPHYNDITGKMDAFARRYFTYSGRKRTEWVEVWDDTFLYTYRKDKGAASLGSSADLEWVLPTSLIGLENYTLVDKSEHGFREVPIVYHREDIDGPCWTPVEGIIENYELALSLLTQNNAAYAFPIMVLKGDNIEIKGDMYGAVKAITMGRDDDASFMSRPRSSEEFSAQLSILLKMIFLGSFTVMPPEVKSGDLPGVAIKLIYSPSIEKAITDAKEYKNTLNDMIRLFLYAYGVETEKQTQFYNLWIYPYIEPYVHQNTAELINNLVQSVGAGILSHHTASEYTGYDKNNEWDRIIREKKEEDVSDLLYSLGGTDKSKNAGEDVSTENKNQN